MQGWNDERLEKIISVLLRAGVLLSALIVFAGGLCFVWRHGNERVDYRVFHPGPDAYRSIRGVVEAAPTGNCRAIIQLGLLLLIATPIVRVAFSLAGFGLERDWRYVVLTSTVLAILIYSFAGWH